MHPAVDHPEADQHEHRPTDWPTHGGSIAIIPDADREQEDGQREPCPVEGQARKAAVISADVHFHDLWHTGNNLVAATASTRELMTRMGHSTARAALIYQHMTADRDRAIADRLGSMIRKQQGEAGT
ncbi:hypothetical protein ACFUS2_09825 [[Kitasatospora] papulosa]|uniref:hypothetical protein n=1 Tax=[Kitasatospora] papulosa TaxID=1464011 RepID=UPI00362836FE